MILRNSIFWLFFLTVGTVFGQTSIKRIDSLILVAKALNDADSSSKLLSIIKSEAESIGYANGLASYVLTEGVNLYNRGKFDEALEFTYKNEKLVIATADNAKISHLYALRGNCYNNLFFFEKSQECLLMAIQYADRITDKNNKYFSLGRIYRIMAANFNKNPKIRNIDSVIFYHRKSYHIQSQIEDAGIQQAGVIIQAAALGVLFVESGNIDSAKYYFKKSTLLADKHKLSKFAVESLIGLGDITFEQGHLDSALHYYLRGLPFALKSKNSNNIKMIYESLAKTYEKLGDKETSISYYKKYAQAADSIAQANKMAVTVPIEYVIQERENLLQKEKQLRNIYLIFAASVIILSTIIVIILYRNISTSRKNNKALSAMNKEMIAQNEYLQDTLEALEKSTEENNKVMQIIAHDLRSPIAAIVGLSGLLKENNSLAEDDLEMVSLMNTSAEDSLKFINDLLQKESSATVLKKAPVDLHQLLSYCTTQLQYKAREKNQTLTLSSSTLIISVNREKIWRVISNLITNSIKFSPRDATIFISLHTEANHAIISVKDMGIGIPDSLKDEIFSSSKESKRAGTGGEKSFGLGLAISKEIIAEHNGTLTFESNVGYGTTFFITLPVETANT